MKRIVLVAALLVSVLCISAQSRAGGFLFQAGVGLGIPKYGSDLDDALSTAESQPGMTRMKVALDLDLGYAVTEDAYVTVGADGCGDRLSDSYSNWMQINSYLFSVGLRYYPMHTGIYLGAGAGSAKWVTTDSDGDSTSSDPGFGWGACVGYDLGKLRGFGLTLEAKYDQLTIDPDTLGIFMVTANLCWK